VRGLMNERSSWTGNAADLLRVSVEQSSQSGDSTGRPKNPRALAAHLRRAQTCLRTLGIDVAFGREGRAGTRVIRIRRLTEYTASNVSTVSSVRGVGSDPGPAVQAASTAADDADGADASAGESEIA